MPDTPQNDSQLPPQGSEPKANLAGLRSPISDASDLLDSLAKESFDASESIDVASGDQISEAERALLEELSLIAQGGAIDRSVLGDISRDGRFEIEEAEQGWALTLKIDPAFGEGKRVKATAVIDALRERQIRRGVDMQAIKQAEADHAAGKLVEGRVIVKGKRPIPGTPGRVEFYCGEATSDEPECYEDIDSLPPEATKRICKAGAMVARLIQPVVGEDGYDALGQERPAERFADVQMEAGSGVRVEEGVFYAEADGILEVEGSTISVSRVLMITTDVFGEMPPIDFDGSVRIKGCVRDHGSVTATGDITVESTVGVAKIKSHHGSVYLKQGIAGQGEAEVMAAGDIVARFAEKATLQAGGDIVLEVGAVHARLTAGLGIDATKGRGQILGGMALAGQRIAAKAFGNDAMVPTVLMAGYTPERLKHLAELEFKLMAAQARMAKITEAAAKIKRMAGDVTRLAPEQQEVYAKLLRASLVTHRELERLRADRSSFDDREESSDFHGEITASVSLHAGCELTISGARKQVTEAQRGCRVFVEDGRVCIR